MAHNVIIEDSDGNAVDVNWYCSDWCARSDPNYAGWYGCVEVVDNDEQCRNCESILPHD